MTTAGNHTARVSTSWRLGLSWAALLVMGCGVAADQTDRRGEAGHDAGAGPPPAQQPTYTPKPVDVVTRPAAPQVEPAPFQIDPRFQPILPTGSADRPPPPLSGGTLRVLADGVTAVASEPDRDVVSVVDLEGGRHVATVALEAGDEPGRIEEDGTGRVHVVLRRAGAVATLSPTDWTVLERRTVCPAPRGVAYQASGDLLHVACAGGELVSLPAGGGAAVRLLRLDPDLRDVVAARNGAGPGPALFVSTFRKAEVIALDNDGREIARLRPPTALNLTRRTVTGTQPPSTTRFEPAVAWRIAAGPDGGVLMLHQRGYTGEISADGGRVAGSYGSAACGGIVQTVVSSMAPGQRLLPSPEIAGAIVATDLAVAADGRVAVVSGADAHVAGSGSLVTVGALAPLLADTMSGCTQQPFSLAGAVPPPGSEVTWSEPAPSGITSNRVRGQAVAVRFDGRGQVVVQMREPREIRVPSRGLVIPLAGTAELSTGSDAGHALFHANSGGGIACASCHPEGGEDGRVWKFTRLGPRRTQSLRGGVSATVPLHWDGDMKDVRLLVTEVFTRRMGGPLVSDEQAASLGRWLDSIPLVPPSPAGSADAIARGEALFSGVARCATCHAGPAFTNNTAADVGTGAPFQVPALRGAWLRAPYMHNGCAETLVGRFVDSCGGSRHGGAGLSAQNVADLQAYLESL